MQVREVVQRAIVSNGDFKHAVLEVCLDRQGQPSTKLLGYYLRRHVGEVINGYRLVRAIKTKIGTPWKVERVNPAKINQPETSSPSSPTDSKKSLEPLQGKDFRVGDDAKVSSPTLNPLQGKPFSDSKQSSGDDGDDVLPRYKMNLVDEQLTNGGKTHSTQSVPSFELTNAPQPPPNGASAENLWMHWTKINTAVLVLRYGDIETLIRVPGEPQPRKVPTSELEETA
jgi:hypothetical protein